MKTQNTLFLVDGSSYIYRAFHAISHLSNSTGMPTNAIFGYARMLLKLIKDKTPQFIVVLFDMKGPTFRHELYSKYKANRPPMPDELVVQIPYIKEMTQVFQIPMLEIQGVEADDLIGTLAVHANKSDIEVVMVSGDKDLQQLVTPTSIIWDPMKDKIIDIDYIHKEFCLKPDQLIDMMGLSGDTSDNIPGVPGIGPKTALKLIQTFHNINTLYERIDEITSQKQKDKLIEYRAQALLSRELVTINTNVALPFEFDIHQFELKEPDYPKLIKLFQTLEFRQLQKEFQLEHATTVQQDTSENAYHAILNQADFVKLIERLNQSQVFAIDTETTSEHPLEAELVGISVAFQPKEAFYIPLDHCYIGSPEQLNKREVLTQLKPILENSSIAKIGQNIKYDSIIFEKYGIRLSGVIFDTMLASYLLNPSKRAHNLDQIALDYLNYQKISFEDTVKGQKHPLVFSEVEIEKATQYACEDADITLRSYHVLSDLLKKQDLETLYNSVELPLISVLKYMEIKGIRVDRNRLSSLSQTFEHELMRLENQIYAVAGEPFNIQSSQQLGHILFEALKLPVQKKTKKKTGYSTDVEVLETLAQYHDLPKLILRHRGLSKLKSTYADALITLIHPKTGRIHTSFNQTVTATGRLSSSDPNLQNIPIKDEEGKQIRSAFIPQDGYSLMSADYSQIELRLLAHYSDDPILIESFIHNQDIHSRTAQEIFHLPMDNITSELRRQAKTINFGIIYGMGAFSLSKELGISRKMADTYIDHYFSRYQGVKRFIDTTIQEAKENLYVKTLLGRIRAVPDVRSRNANIRSAAERIAVNTPIQGTAADLIKIAMIRIYEALVKEKFKSAMLLSVHDELIFEVCPDEKDKLTSMVIDIMEHVWELKVPLKVNVGFGQDWSQAH
ncbi:MAG: DNA polymerase I [Desulfobacterales bacterium]|nr:DNA polymerase I [Desulfobacterales bacterium]